MSEYTRLLPVVALKNMAVMPGMLIHFDINRKISMEAVEEAMLSDQKVLLVAQIDSDVEKPKQEDLYEMGTVAEIKQMIKLPGNVVRVLVSGIARARLDNIVNEIPYLKGCVTVQQEEELILGEVEREGMLRGLRDLFEVYETEYGKLNKDVVHQVKISNNLEKIVEQLMIHIPMTLQDKQRMLCCSNFEERYEQLTITLANEIEIIRIKKELQSKVKDKVDKNQKDYIMREQLKVIREELGETNTASDVAQYREELVALTASDEVKALIEKEIERYLSIASSTSEGAVSRGYVEMLLSLPWDKVSVDKNDIHHAKKVLDQDHYGLEKVKDRILEFLAVRQLAKKGDSPIICLVGPPGTGKTSIARSVARALGKEYVRVCLGGVRDEAEIRGHRRTYVGALPGRMITGLKQAKVKNPLMLLDEIDKVGSDQRGDTASALLEVLDSEQNMHFVDHYIEIPVDLSEILFIATANTTQTIPKPLLDRMEIIEISSYTEMEKLHIAKEHLVSKQLSKNGLSKSQLSISDKALERLIQEYTREAGVRSLERNIAKLCRKTARKLLENPETKKIRISDKNLKEFLGKEKYHRELANKEAEVGIVRGLAWTSVGGTTLQIEVNTMPGKGVILLTGQLGDVMKESAQTGISYIRSIGEEYGIADDYFEKHDIHIHIPEGATPKDGPSAGITMATAVLSAVISKKVRAEVAMTGEITLRGHVLPIGGLKEKLLAAKLAGIQCVLIPSENRADYEEIETEITDGLNIVCVGTMKDVLKHALC